MKRKFFIILVVAVAATISVHAQTTAERQMPVKKGDEWQMPKDVLLRSRALSQHLKKTLGLDSATTLKVFDLYLGNRKSVDEIAVGTGTPEDKKNALAANQSEFDQKIKELVTAKQYDLYMRERKYDKISQ
jgi:hypothetical protein